MDDWFDDLAEGVVLIESGRVRLINAAAAELLDFRRELAVGEPLFAVVRDHRIERVWQERKAEELKIRGRRVEVVPLRGGLALRDVEERRKAIDDARELLAVLSHELRTPMTTVRATLEALEYDELPPARRASLLARALAESDRVVRLLDDLTVQVAPPRERSVALRDAAERVVGLLEDTLAARNVRVSVDVEDLLVWVDPDKLVQVLLNLLENAAVHGPADSEAVLAAAADSAVGSWARITVTDEGEPIPEERVEALFAPHSRGAAAGGKGSGGKGTGLGLYIVRTIVEAWRGRAWGRPLVGPGGEGSGNEFGVLVPLGRGTRELADVEGRP